jgi:hypothetical protein
MKCNVAAAIALEDLDPARGEHFSRSQHIGRPGVASKGNDRRVFKQKQDIANLSRLAQFDQPTLQAQTLAVVDDAELDDGDHGWSTL